MQKNRDVPDTYMTMIEYPGDYSVNMVSCMANETSVPVTVYANWATVQIVEAARRRRRPRAGRGEARWGGDGQGRAAVPERVP